MLSTAGNEKAKGRTTGAYLRHTVIEMTRWSFYRKKSRPEQLQRETFLWGLFEEQKVIWANSKEIDFLNGEIKLEKSDDGGIRT